jgi:hypothetical protein
MANAKVTHRSSAILCDNDGTAVKFSKAKALEYINPERGRVRQVQVSGEWCDMFFLETSVSKKNGSMGLIGISLKGMVLNTTAVKTVAETPRAPSSAAPEVNLSELFGAEDMESSEVPAN